MSVDPLNPDWPVICARIRRLRRWSNLRIALAIGVSHMGLNDISAGRIRNPRYTTGVRILRELEKAEAGR